MLRWWKTLPFRTASVAHDTLGFIDPRASPDLVTSPSHLMFQFSADLFSLSFFSSFLSHNLDSQLGSSIVTGQTQGHAFSLSAPVLESTSAAQVAR